MNKKVALSLVAASLVTSSAFGASSLEEAFKKGTVNGEIRAMYYGKSIDDTTKQDINSFGVGGKLHFETDSLYGVKAAATFYNATRLPWTQKAETEAYIVNNDLTSFSILGEAYLQLDIGKTTFKVGRQQIDSPLAGSDDVRLVPNTFEAGVIVNKDLSDTTLVAAYVRSMAGLDKLSGAFSTYDSMSKSAGVEATAGGKPVYVLGAVNSSVKDLTVQVWDYYAVDVLNAVYADAVYAPKVGDLTVTLGAQYYTEKAVGKVKDANSALVDYSVYGLKVAVASEKLGTTLTLATNGVSEDSSKTTLYTFGAWGGYPEWAVAEEFWMNTGLNMNGASTYKAALDYDLGKLGLGKRTLTAAYTMFDVKDKYQSTTPKDRDTNVIDVIYSCDSELVKNLKAKVVYEMVNSKDSSLDSSVAKIQLSYSF